MVDLSGLSVLLVEDEFLIALDGEDMLRACGASAVTLAGTFEDAERCIAENKFDIAIMDVNLNGRLSFPLAEALLQRGTAVLFCTGYNLTNRPLDGYDGGACIMKPYSA